MFKRNPDVDIDVLRFQRSQRYFCSNFFDVAATTATLSANNLYASPIFIPVTTAFDQIAINVTTAVAGNARLGIYEDNGRVYPGRLVIDAGEVATGTTGVKTISIAPTLKGGKLYWVAIAINNGSAIRSLAVGSLLASYLGLDSTLGTAFAVGYTISQTYGALPNPFPTGATIATAHSSGVFLRKR